RMMFKVNMHWELHVWELTGAPDTWQAQLRNKLAEQPVFAVLSGLGGQTWDPIHRFCEEQSLPCLFPNLELPVVAENDFDNLYLSQGVLLEARLVSHELRPLRETTAVKRVVQVFRTGDVGASAARALERALAGSGVSVVSRAVGPGRDRELAAVIHNV